MKQLRLAGAWLFCVYFGCVGVRAEAPLDAARGLLQRVLPAHADLFQLESLAQDGGQEAFEIEAQGGKIVLRGSSPVAVASALNWYLKHCCHASVSLSGMQIALPHPLPKPAKKIHIATPFQYRYCFNYCCFSYSMAWWDWPQWERVIDWMALHGVNMPLAVTGQEAVWQAVCKTLGLEEEALNDFFVGAAYLPFGWMGCMDGWGGPLPQTWIAGHADLQRKILARERALGMTPVLQGFTGHIPAALKNKFSGARFQQLPSWCGFPGTQFIDPQDPLFRTLGKLFVEEQTRLYGTDHLYAADTFIEMSPPSNEPSFLDAMAKAVHGAMTEADPAAIWVMQGWLFVNNPGFWQPPQAKALLDALPKDRMIVLDLYCEERPAWEKTESFYGNPWVWCIIQDFGDQVSLHGGLPVIMQNLDAAVMSPKRGQLRGAGFIMEGLGYNPVVYDFMSDQIWKPGETGLETWIEGYASRRYGRRVDRAGAAWRQLLATAYAVPSRASSAITTRPSWKDHGGWKNVERAYDPGVLREAGEMLMTCAGELGALDTYRYDIVHVTRQVLSDLADAARVDIGAAIASGDRQGLAKAGVRFLGLMRDMDALLATRGEFLLGRWLGDAARWAANDDERRRYTWNARNQITLWGPKDSVLHDYAAKQWAGLIQGFYVPRWEQFLQRMDIALAAGQPFDDAAFERDIQAWEEAWTHGMEPYADQPEGDSVQEAQRLWEKYGR